MSNLLELEIWFHKALDKVATEERETIRKIENDPLTPDQRQHVMGRFNAQFKSKRAKIHSTYQTTLENFKEANKHSWGR